MQICKICGNYLETAKYSLVEGYSSSGKLIMSREVLEDDNKNLKFSKMEYDSVKVLDCRSNFFINEIKKEILIYNTLKL